MKSILIVLLNKLFLCFIKIEKYCNKNIILLLSNYALVLESLKLFIKLLLLNYLNMMIILNLLVKWYKN